MTPERPSGVDEIVWQSLPVDIQHELSAAAANTASHDLADSTETANDKHVHSPNTHTSRKRAAEKHVQSVACQKKKKQAKLSFEATADTAAVVEPSDSSNISPLYIDTAFAPGPSSIDGYSYSGDSSNSSGLAIPAVYCKCKNPLSGACIPVYVYLHASCVHVHFALTLTPFPPPPHLPPYHQGRPSLQSLPSPHATGQIRADTITHVAGW